MNDHSALTPAGPIAAEVLQLGWLFFVVSAVVYLLVIAFLIYALVRARARKLDTNAPGAAGSEKKAWLAISAAFVLTVVTLVGLMGTEFASWRSLNRHVPDPIRIILTGHQWWWEIEYEDAQPSKRLRTANELHIPVGRPVQLILTSRDVIHSFWVPSLAGKRDLIPGHITSTLIQAERPGTYTGQCAEFCGFQHARMGLIVHAHEPAEFESWKQQQLASAREPVSPEEQRGREVFAGSTCVMCHSIQGTEASATVGPDLTHIASRRTIGTGTLPNTPANLASWIRDPQRVKPGTHMPASPLAPQDLSALAAYLASLQ
jgi:cytochrome c oxidase subunit II